MNKKIISGLLIAAIIGLLASCGNGGDKSFVAFQKVQHTMQTLEDASYEINAGLQISSKDADGKTTPLSTSTNMILIGREVVHAKNNIDRMLKTTYHMGEQGIDTTGTSKGANERFTIYMKRNMTYIDMNGIKLKSNQPNPPQGIGMTDYNAQKLLGISKDIVSNLTISKEGDNTIYFFLLKPRQAMDYFKNSVTSAEQTMKGYGNGTGELKKVNVIITADRDNKVTTMSIDAALQTKLDTLTTDFHYQLSIKYTSINTGLKINFPDLSQYTK